MNKRSFNLKKLLFGRINRRITLLFLMVGIVAPAIGIYYFYSISLSILPQDPAVFAEKRILLDTAAVIISALIAIDAGIVGFFVSRSISKPIGKLYEATRELEKGNFSVRTDIQTNDEIEQLSRAFNKSAIALGRMKKERQQLDKTKSEFLSMASHELRTPMTPLKAQLQMLQQQYFGKLSDKQRESLGIILKNTERLNKIIEDFLEISRIEVARLRFVFKKTNMLETVKETVSLMESFAKEKNIKLIINTGGLPMIQVDPDRVSQVLRNLVHNAIKFSKNDSKIEINTSVKKDHILFGVKDYGVGMSPKDKIRVFEPFFQVEETLSREHGGTGLGLAICKGIVESQKGEMRIESSLGKGSTFYFTVPLRPVEKIEPIRVLFSPKIEIENELKEEFIVLLGPMGITEFNELKDKSATGKDEIFGYIDSLEKLNILRNTDADKFKINVGKIFGDEPIKEENHKLDNETLKKEI